jgi:transcriptional regulator with XRE-family HTH domain
MEMTQDEVAEKSGLHVTHISDLEHGRGNPTLRTIERLAHGLGVLPAHIFSLEDFFERKRKRGKRS